MSAQSKDTVEEQHFDNIKKSIKNNNKKTLQCCSRAGVFTFIHKSQTWYIDFNFQCRTSCILPGVQKHGTGFIKEAHGTRFNPSFNVILEIVRKKHCKFCPHNFFLNY